ncbi:MAG: WD40 repeat domain-containing serine/threonine-protein kinase [Planctomycetota bacterium]
MTSNDPRVNAMQDDTKDVDREELDECERLNQWIEQDTQQVISSSTSSALQMIALELRQLATDRLSESAARTGHHSPSIDSTTVPEIDNYEIIDVLGKGGMGIVYSARDLRLRRDVAIKALPTSSLGTEKSQRRFLIEVQAAAQLEHENIVPVYEYGTYSGGLYYSMRRIDGVDLAQKLALHDDHTTSLKSNDCGPAVVPGNAAYRRWAARIVRQLALALDHSHDQFVIHRDIKPANILVDREGNPFLTDFGLARVNDGTDLTEGGDLIGTIRYMSPEQLTGSEAVGPQSDVYSLGLTLFELVTGKPAISTEVFNHAVKQISEGRIAKPRSLNPKVEVDLETIILKAISPEPKTRYTSSLEFADDLERFLAIRPIRARRPTIALHLNRWYRRNAAWATALIGLCALVVVLVIGVTLFELRRSSRDAKTIRRYAVALSDVEGVSHLRRSRGPQALASFQKSIELNSESEENLKQRQRMSAIQRWSPHLVEKHLSGGRRLAWLPDGRRIERRHNGDQQSAVIVQPNGQTRSLFSTGGKIRFLRRNLQDNAFAFVIGDSTNRDFQIKIYEVESDQIRTLAPEPWRITQAWFSKDSKSLYATGWGGDIFKYDLESNSVAPVVRTKYPDTAPITWVYSSAVDKDRSIAVSALNPGQLVAYDLSNLEPIWQSPIELNDWRVDVLQISNDSKWFVAGTSKDQVRLWHIASGTELKLLNNVVGTPTVAAFSPDDQSLVVGDSRGGVYRWKLPSEESILVSNDHQREAASESRYMTEIPRDGVVMWHEAAVRILDFNASHELLVAAGSEVHTWRLGDQQPLANVISLEDQINSAKWLNERQIRLTSRRNDLDTEWVWGLPEFYARRLELNGQPRRIVLNSRQKSISCITDGKNPSITSLDDEASDKRAIHANEIALPKSIDPIFWTTSGDGQRITIVSESNPDAEGNKGCSVKTYELANLESVVAETHLNERVSNIRLNADGTRWLASDGYSGIRVGTVDSTGETFQVKLPNWFAGAVFLDSNHFAAICWDQTLRIWDDSGFEIVQFKLDERPTNLAYRAGTIVVAAGQRAHLFRRDVDRDKSSQPTNPQWKKVAVCSHEGSFVQFITIASNAESWFSSDASGLNRLWTRSGDLIAEFSEKSLVETCRFSLDGRWLATISESGCIRLYDGRTGQIMAPSINAQNPIDRICWTEDSLLFAGTQEDQSWLSEIQLPPNWISDHAE